LGNVGLTSVVFAKDHVGLSDRVFGPRTCNGKVESNVRVLRHDERRKGLGKRIDKWLVVEGTGTTGIAG
jgi:hypothetical protein